MVFGYFKACLTYQMAYDIQAPMLKASDINIADMRPFYCPYLLDNCAQLWVLSQSDSHSQSHWCTNVWQLFSNDL